ncbi:MAG: ABC transporter permease [Treponema sp.]|jgi:ribose/xylose/arabinose/galactoside ABC-type transport system permease subunit|nr:ABC transporter permease [Treponema sp.]
MKIKKFFLSYRIQFSVLGVMVLLLIIFAIMNPKVFLSYNTYRALFIVYPIPLMLVCGLVFVTASGESDLSFPSTIGIALWLFSLITLKTGYPFFGFFCAILSGLLIGLVNGLLITKLKLSSLVVTLGMNFLLRGLIMIGTSGHGIPLTFLNKSTFYKIFVGKIGDFPIQMLWGLVFMGICILVFNFHRFGAHVCYVGDNPTSAAETGVKVERIKIGAYMVTGLAAALAGVFTGLVNNAFFPTSGSGYLLTSLAAVFLGGTPTWGGIGTILGGAIGAFILSFLENGIISSGLTGFYTQFFFGLIIVLALISHKFTGIRRKGN